MALISGASNSSPTCRLRSLAITSSRLVYQPRLDLSSGACVGFEALLRWCHPLLGNVSPAEFMPVVEQTDLARPVTEWVIETAIGHALAWRRAGIDLPIAVNVSVSNLEQPDFAEWLIQRLSAAQLPSSAIEVEVTESSLVQNGTRVGQHLQEIRDAGMKVAIDDFGTGYSSLSYLQSLPADIVKIDQSFMRNLASNPRGRTLVASMVAMRGASISRLSPRGSKTTRPAASFARPAATKPKAT